MATFSVDLVRRYMASGAAPTLVTIAPLKWATLTVTRDLGAPGSCQVGCSVDSLDVNAKANLIDQSATPCEVWVYRNATLIFAGPITGLRIQKRQLTVTAGGLATYLGYMVATAAQSYNADQATIVKSLIDTFQAQTFGNYGLVTSTIVTTGITRTLTFAAADLKHVDSLIASMGTAANGFDLWCDPVTRGVFVYYPRQGADLSASVFLDGRVMADADWQQSVGPGQITSDGYVVGAGVVGSAANATLRGTFGRAVMTGSTNDVTGSTMLNDLASRFVDDNDQPLIGLGTQLKSLPGHVEWGTFNIGDIVAVQFDAGLGSMSFQERVKTIKLTPDGDTENLEVSFV